MCEKLLTLVSKRIMQKKKYINVEKLSSGDIYPLFIELKAKMKEKLKP